MMPGAILKPQIPDLVTKIREAIGAGRYWQTQHAVEMSIDRGIPLPDILYVLKTGRRNETRSRYDWEHEAWNYAIDGATPDGGPVRTIVSFDNSRSMIIITVIDVD